MSEAPPAEGTARAVPFYCPYCGEQDIRPGVEQATYRCRTCTRGWRLEYRGMGSEGGDDASDHG